MKRIGTKQIVPLMLAVFAVVFAVIGFTQLGFWSAAGLFPGHHGHCHVPDQYCFFFSVIEG